MEIVHLKNHDEDSQFHEDFIHCGSNHMYLNSRSAKALFHYYFTRCKDNEDTQTRKVL